jgi:hypothetical protein
MKKSNVHLFAKTGGIVCALFVLVAGFSTAAIAQCGVSFTSMAEAAIAIQARSQAPVVRALAGVNDSRNDNDGRHSIVGLWHIRFMVGPNTIQEAYQIWNQGGTEAHNPNVDPRGGSICLGAWDTGPRRSYRLTHRVWNYDTNGIFLGTIHLSETLTLGNGGNTHSGTFTLDFYDPNGVFQFSVPGDVIGERISVE